MIMEKNFDAPEQVILIPTPRTIRIIPSMPERAYGLFDTKTGTQVKDFVKGNGEEIEFKDLSPDMHYDVGVIEGMGDDKPYFAIMWNQYMRDVTDDILKNSNDLPIKYPCAYQVIFNDKNSNGTYDLVDGKGEIVGQVANLTQTGDKPIIEFIHSFRMKEVTKE